MSNSISFWQRIRRTPYQAVASVFMIFITLFVFAVFLLLAATSSAILSYFETKPQVTIFFNDKKDKSAIDALVDKLKSTGKIAGITYISKDQALSIYREQNKNDPLLLEMVTADILPASLEISAVSPQDLTQVAEMMKDEPGVDEVVFQKDIVDTLVTWTSTIRKIGFFFLIFLLIATFFILLTSIGMKIALKKEEVDILKLVGATPWYIRKPFIYEGVTYGLLGATITWVIVIGLVLYAKPFISTFLYGIPSSLSLMKIGDLSLALWPPVIAHYLLLWCILNFAGVFIGLFGSLLAVSRYLKN